MTTRYERSIKAVWPLIEQYLTEREALRFELEWALGKEREYKEECRHLEEEIEEYKERIDELEHDLETEERKRKRE